MPWGDGRGPGWANGNWTCRRGRGYGLGGYGFGHGRGIPRGWQGYGSRFYNFGAATTDPSDPLVRPYEEDEAQALDSYIDWCSKELEAAKVRLLRIKERSK